MTTYDFISANKRKTAVLMAVFFAVVLGLGYILDRAYGFNGSLVVVAAGYSTLSALVSYYAGDQVALVTAGAVAVTETENPYLVRMVENLCIATGTARPKVYVIPDPAINAFATGRDPAHASIAVTSGALERLANEFLDYSRGEVRLDMAVTTPGYLFSKAALRR